MNMLVVGGRAVRSRIVPYVALYGIAGTAPAIYAGHR